MQKDDTAVVPNQLVVSIKVECDLTGKRAVSVTNKVNLRRKTAKQLVGRASPSIICIAGPNSCVPNWSTGTKQSRSDAQSTISDRTYVRCMCSC